MNTQRQDLSEALIDRMANLREDEVLELVRRRVDRNDDPVDIMEDCRVGMTRVGQKYEEHTYYLAGLILAGEILKEVLEIVGPLTERKYSGKSLGLILLGTVAGDIHDAGKELFQCLLNVHGFKIRDLGVDVPPEEFAERAKELKPSVVGLSCLLVGSYASMKETIALMRSDRELERIPVIIGGQVNQEISDFVGANHWSTDAMDGVRWCQNYVTMVYPSDIR